MNNIVPGSFQLMKKINTGLILDTIRLKGPISRADIARLLNLTPATVTNITGELISRNVIVEGSLGISSGGRKPIMLMLNKDAYYVAGIQIDNRKIRAAILNIECQILDEITVNFDKNLNDMEIIDLILNSVQSLIDTNSIEKNKILGLGAGVNGIVNFNDGKIVYSPVFKSENINIRNILESKFDIPVYADRDVRVMALRESWVGAAKDVETFFCISTGETICAAIVNNKQLIRGINDGLGEIGHMKITQKGYKCSCGNYGCLETCASENAIVRYVNENSIDSILDIDEVHRLSLNGDKNCIDAIQKAGRALGVGIANLINTFNPGLIIVGGEFIYKNDFYFNSMLESIEENSLKQLLANTRIEKSFMINDSIIKGAGLMVIDNLFDTFQ